MPSRPASSRGFRRPLGGVCALREIEAKSASSPSTAQGQAKCSAGRPVRVPPSSWPCPRGQRAGGDRRFRRGRSRRRNPLAQRFLSGGHLWPPQVAACRSSRRFAVVGDRVWRALLFGRRVNGGAVSEPTAGPHGAAVEPCAGVRPQHLGTRSKYRPWGGRDETRLGNSASAKSLDGAAVRIARRAGRRPQPR